MMIPPETWAFLGVVIGGAFSGATTWLVAREKNRSDSEFSLVDNLQEELIEARHELRALKQEMRDASREAYEIQNQARLMVSLSWGYISQLHAHIEAGSPPPPPNVPDELKEFFLFGLSGASKKTNDER